MIWNNIKTSPQRWAAYWLRRQGWVVFYLEPHSRMCVNNDGSINKGFCCWLDLYQQGENHDASRS